MNESKTWRKGESRATANCFHLMPYFQHVRGWRNMTMGIKK